MDEFVVNNQEELRAAVMAAGRSSYEETRNNPAKITLGTCIYTFSKGLTDARAKQIARNIRKVSAAYFEVKESRV